MVVTRARDRNYRLAPSLVLPCNHEHFVSAQNVLTQLEHPWPGIPPFWNGKAALSLRWNDPNLQVFLLEGRSIYSLSGYELARQDKCHFAGEHCSVNFQGFMEGGAEEGQRAANEILADYEAAFSPEKLEKLLKPDDRLCHG